VAQNRKVSNKRRVFKGLLAFGLGVSVILPNLWGQPPKGTLPKDGDNPKRVQIRFPAETRSPEVAQQPAGKLAADVSKSNLGQGAKLEPAASISVATNEEKNQKVADWKDPLFVFVLTGNQTGYMEPCGCTGLENQKGGLSRRDTLLTSIRQRGWEVLPIDAGGQVFKVSKDSPPDPRRGSQADIKFRWSANAFNLLDYQAVAFGEDDLLLTEVALINAMLDKPGLYVSANVGIWPDSDVKYKTVMVKNKKIGITAVLGDENAKNVDNDVVTISKAIPSLSLVAAQMRKEKCDYQVLIAHASLEESRAIAKAVPEFTLVLTSGGFGEPAFQPEKIPGTPSLMVQAGAKGMYAGLVGVFDDPKNPVKYQRIALSSQFEDSPRVTELFGKYQDELKAVTVNGLGKRPMTHQSTREFVGSEKCGECHTTAFEIWKNTPHAHATDSIVQPPQRTMARHFDPECLACHVTGWNPLNFAPYRTGYESLEKTPHMVANGCENCHGPGSKHVEVELGDAQADTELVKKLREEMKLPLDRASDKCVVCHDLDNSPEFKFESHWEKVKHTGKD
jgi:hypothetical protein